MTTTKKSLTLKKDDGKPLWMLGSLYTIKISSDDSGGAVSVVEFTIPHGPNSAPPPHRHNCGETVYVQEGTVKYQFDGKTSELGPGSVAFFPKGTLENFEVVGSRPAKLLVVYTPGGMDKFFAEAAEPAKSRSLPPPSSNPPDIPKLISIGKKHGLELQAPKH